MEIVKDYKKTRYNFEQEIARLIIKNRKSSPKLIREKLSNCFEDWKDLMPEYMAHDNLFNKQKANEDWCIINTLKTGVFESSQGIYKISEISFINKDKDNVLVTFKNGQQLKFSSSFNFLFKVI